MMLPTKGELDKVAALIGGEGTTFDALPPENRVQVLQLAIAAKANELASTSKDLLNEIDTSLSHVASWFEQSKIYWP
jgi:hypothetical protein